MLICIGSCLFQPASVMVRMQRLSQTAALCITWEPCMQLDININTTSLTRDNMTVCLTSAEAASFLLMHADLHGTCSHKLLDVQLALPSSRMEASA